MYHGVWYLISNTQVIKRMADNVKGGTQVEKADTFCVLNF